MDMEGFLCCSGSGQIFSILNFLIYYYTFRITLKTVRNTFTITPYVGRISGRTKAMYRKLGWVMIRWVSYMHDDKRRWQPVIGPSLMLCHYNTVDGSECLHRITRIKLLLG